MGARAILAALGMASAGMVAAQETDERLALGREVFLARAEPACAVCHTLAEAGAEGAVGPNLDSLQPSAEQVERAVTMGLGVMPSYGDALSAEEIAAVAHYVATAAAGG